MALLCLQGPVLARGSLWSRGQQTLTQHPKKKSEQLMSLLLIVIHFFSSFLLLVFDNY